MTNLPKTDAQGLPELWKFMLDPLFENILTSDGLNSLRQKGCHILVKNWIFNDPFHKKIASIGYFGAIDDQTIKISNLFWEIGLKRLLRPVRLQRPLRSMRLERFLRPGKSQLRTSESSRFLNSIILGLILLYFDVFKKKSLTESWNLMLNFSTFSFGGC